MTSEPRYSGAAFETVIEHHLPEHGYIAVSRDSFDRGRATVPSVVLDFIKGTQPKSGRSSSHSESRILDGWR